MNKFCFFLFMLKSGDVATVIKDTHCEMSGRRDGCFLNTGPYATELEAIKDLNRIFRPEHIDPAFLDPSGV